MDLDKQIRLTILELTSESEYGSWELWGASNQDTADMHPDKKVLHDKFINTIEVLIKENKLVALSYKQKDHSYTPVVLERARLEFEMDHADKPVHETFYWFESTEMGKEEDQILRRERFNQQNSNN